MRLSFGQQMQMAQKQVLAPRMIQSMEILQLPILALQERIEQEMEDNPVLDKAELTDETSDLEEESYNSDAPTESEKELVVRDDTNNEDDFERLMNMTDNLPDEYEERSRPSRGQMEAESDRHHDAMANMVSRPESLLDYLDHQLSWFDLDAPLKKMCERIIYNLDSNGYLKSPLEELIPPAPTDINGDSKSWRAEQLQLAESALAIVQRLDPPGIAARSLKECLLLQLTPGLLFFEELQVLIENHLEDLENNRLPLIVKKTGFSIETIQEAWEDLRTLKPKPGAEFNETFAPSVTPDVYVERKDEGGYEVRLEDTQLPSLYISNTYRNLLQDPTTNAETREYIKRKVNSAQWIIEAIEQRRSTLTKVSQAIVDHQTSFLDNGPEFIEPLKMQQIADKVGVHVTTVSRAVDDKWMQTPRGIFPLKRFFVGGTTSADGEEVAWDKVRLKLQEIVDNEDKTKPLSDDALVDELAKAGITVARRTVTKYRKAMDIPSSRQRRDWSKEK
ncbi:RNA polymerase factor sigma-54 [Bythopirellula polymerisocia]|uniref:RNA polymerase sigma-54 factor 1 n=1 Tax=Bythopirellula polymerisocia TaxID=2528003 RepID=A0A5C6C491_9BACT|nr:RNA polymerase factor sigma-54 [Bythopirellula polymerisocia]TWU17609.1 RNA polymerase sigma-54 factor 1 [Bythopirellula polymerisocia]